jgi:hypothetical protein
LRPSHPGWRDPPARREAGLATQGASARLRAQGQDAPDVLYLRNTVSLKGLKPGEDDFVIILYDEIGPGPRTRQVLPFRVMTVKLPKPEGEADQEKP